MIAIPHRDEAPSAARPVISVVVPTFGRAALLRDCLESLQAQERPGPPYEIVVVDDGSADDTRSVVETHARGDGTPLVRLLSQSHGGLNAARNLGASAARGELLAFIDDDVLTPPTWLTALAAGAVRFPEADCLGGAIRLRLEGRLPAKCGPHPIGASELDLGREAGPTNVVWGANMAVRREALERVGPFDPHLLLYHEELEWQHRLRAAGGTVAYLPDAWVWHRRRSSDLRVRRLLTTSFAKGRGRMSFAAATGRGGSPRPALARLPRALAHAAVRRCWWGIFEAATEIGFLYELLRRRAERRR